MDLNLDWFKAGIQRKNSVRKKEKIHEEKVNEGWYD